jgi:gamma-glutamyl-gamma-aminobutyrate hydrolase PuuD
MPRPEPTIEKQPRVAVSGKSECYADWVVRGGGTFRLVTPGEDRPLDGVSGLLWTGGEDVDPNLYRETNRVRFPIARFQCHITA